MSFERKRPVTYARWVIGDWYDHTRKYGLRSLLRWQDGRTWREHLAQRWRELLQLVPGGVQ